MSRGFPSQKALDAALPVAQVRGEVIFFRQDPGTPGDFQINSPWGSAVVRVKRTRRLHCTVAGIEAECAGPLAPLRSATLIPGIARELWLWSPHGSMRFFRIEKAGLTELDRLGEPLQFQSPVAASGKKPVGKKVPENITGNPAPGKNYEPGKNPGNIEQAPGAPAPVHGPGTAAVKEPPAIRYLRHRMKEKIPPPHHSAGPVMGTPDGGVPGDGNLPPPVP